MQVRTFIIPHEKGTYESGNKVWFFFVFFLNKYDFIYLVVPGLNCSMGGLWLQHAGFSAVA